MTTGADATRPGQTYFVPGVRISKLGKLRPGPEQGVELTEVQPDILWVQVTLVHHGVGQYCFRLNNWYDTLPADRAAPHPPRMANEVTIGNVPAWPRFKYNDFSIFRFGDRLRIDMRYFAHQVQGRDTTEGLDPVTAESHQWVPMISGPISDIQFHFTEDEGNFVQICGEDDLCPLKDKNCCKIDYWAVPEKEVIADVLKRANYPLKDVVFGPYPLPKFAEQTAKAMAEAHFEGTSYLDYLKKFAERMDRELFVEFADIGKPESGVDLHFERARSRLPPDRTLRGIYLIERGNNLHSFKPDIKPVDQCTSVNVTGRNRVSSSPDRISADVPQKPPVTKGAATQWLDDELHRDPARQDPPLVAGPDWRLEYFGENHCAHPNQRGVDPERAAVMADAKFRQQARRFLKVEIETLGLPRLRPGQHVEIRGMRQPFDGFYYAETCEHTYGPDGLRTRVFGRRPGMPFPPYGEQ